MKKTFIPLAMLAMFIFTSCGKNQPTSDANPSQAVPEKPQEYYEIPVDNFKKENAGWFAIDDDHRDTSTVVYAYDAKTDSPVDCKFYSGYRFLGRILGNQVYTCLPGFNEVYFKKGDVHREF